MYNLYTYEKQKEKLQAEKEKKRKEFQIEKKHKEQVKELANNYSKRIEKFIFRMIEAPVQINNINYSNFQSLDPYNSHSFSYRNLKSEREIKEMIRLQNEENLHHKKKIIKFVPPTVFQPEMHFKPRNDWERILESVKLNHGIDSEDDKKMKDYDKIRKEQIKRIRMEQIRNIEKKRKEDLKVIKKNPSAPNLKLPNTLKFTHNFANKTFFNATNQVLLNHLWDKNIDYSSEMKKGKEGIFSTTFINFNNKPKPSSSAANLFTIHSKLEPNEMSHIFNRTLDVNDEIRKEPPDDFFPQNNFKVRFQSKSEVPFYNPLESTKEKKVKLSPEDLLYLRNISKEDIIHLPFESEQEKIQKKNKIRNEEILQRIRNKSEEILQKVKGAKNFKKQEEVDELYDSINSKAGYEFLKVGNEIFRKDDVKNITHKVLEHCGYTHHKYNANDTKLKKGEGKMMMTNGMSIRKFLAKYSLPIISSYRNDN